jgi:hypothetical protein
MIDLRRITDRNYVIQNGLQDALAQRHDIRVHKKGTREVPLGLLTCGNGQFRGFPSRHGDCGGVRTGQLVSLLRQIESTEER